MSSYESSSRGGRRGRRLRLRRRQQPQFEGDHDDDDSSSSNNRSLFARLTPSVVNSLYQDALVSSCTNTTTDDDDNSVTTNGKIVGGGWKISSTTSTKTSERPVVLTLDFLPLEVQFISGRSSPNSNHHHATTTTTIYVSYNGGIPAEISNDDEEKDILELPECMIPQQNTPPPPPPQVVEESSDDDYEVIVTALPSIQDADILFVEPLTIEDWELLETCAEFAENALLQQVSVVYSNQVLPLWVGGKDTAWIRILPKNFNNEQPQPKQQITSYSSSSSSAAAHWPSLEEMNSTSGSSNSSSSSNNNNNKNIKCLRLMQNTRVDVSPKSRHQSAGCTTTTTTATLCLRVLPTRQDYSNPMNELSESILGREQIVSTTTPGTVWINPAMMNSSSSEEEKEEVDGNNDCGGDDVGTSTSSTLLAFVWNAAFGPTISAVGDGDEEENDGNDDDDDDDDGTSQRRRRQRSCILKIAFSNNVPEQHVAIHPLTRSRLDVLPLMNNVFLRLLSPIEVARGSTWISQQEGKQMEISLQKVEIYENRTAKKWRYPRELLNSNSDRGSSSQRFTYYQNDLEPIEDGSFLLAVNPQGTEHALYQASFIEKAAESSSSNNKKSGSGRCFVLRNQLQQLSINLHDNNRSRPLLIPTSIGTNVRYELRSQSLLLNLLGDDSVIPAELTAIKEQRLMLDAIVYGAVGSGKSHTALVLAAFARFQSNAPTFYLDCKRLKQGRSIRMKDILAEFDRVFHDASTCGGDSVLILDDLDELSPNLEHDNGAEDSAQSHQINPVAVDQAKLIGDYLRRHLEIDTNKKSVSVIITCRDRHALLPSILHGRPFSRVVETPNLTAQERECILWNMIVSGSVMSDNIFKDAFKSCRIGRKTDTFWPRDLQLLASKVRHTLRSTGINLSPAVIADCTNKALETFVPLRQLSVSEEKGAADWSEIGGLFHVKEVLTSSILNPAKYRRIYENARIRLPRGFLIFGSPGNGKSYLVPALAKKCGFALVTCRGPELLDRYIGASESKVRELFARAASSSPSILFFDEIESLAPRRGSDNSGVTDRVVNQLLTLLDGVEDSNAKGLVYVIAATSRPDIVDPALLRPGRLEKHVYVGTPDSEDEYSDMIMKIASRYSINDEVKAFISSGLCAREAKSISPNFDRLSCADFKAAFDTAQLGAIHELLGNGQTNGNVTIGIHHITDALSSTRPSLPERDYAMLMEVYRPFRKNPADESSSSRQPVGRKLRTALR